MRKPVEEACGLIHLASSPATPPCGLKRVLLHFLNSKGTQIVPRGLTLFSPEKKKKHLKGNTHRGETRMQSLTPWPLICDTHRSNGKTNPKLAEYPHPSHFQRLLIEMSILTRLSQPPLQGPLYTNPHWRSDSLGSKMLFPGHLLFPQAPRRGHCLCSSHPQEDSLPPTTAHSQPLVCPFQEEGTPF